MAQKPDSGERSCIAERTGNKQINPDEGRRFGICDSRLRGLRDLRLIRSNEKISITESAHAAAWGVARTAGAGGWASAATAPDVGRVFSSLCSSEAPMKAAKSGCGSRGLDLNSGWNWQPRNQGWFGASMIST